MVVHLDQGFISVLNDDNGIPDLTGCHPNVTPRGVLYSGPDQALLETETTITKITPAASTVFAPTATSRKSIGGSGISSMTLGMLDTSGRVSSVASTLDSLLPSVKQMLLKGGVIGSGEPRDAFSYPTSQLATFHSPVTSLAYTKESVSSRLARKLYYIVAGNPDHVYPRKLSKKCVAVALPFCPIICGWALPRLLRHVTHDACRVRVCVCVCLYLFVQGQAARQGPCCPGCPAGALRQRRGPHALHGLLPRL